MTARADLVVLIAEDLGARGDLAQALQVFDVRLEATASGWRGLDAVSQLEPDVVLIDLHLPDIDGVEACRKLRRWFRNPILAVSSPLSPERTRAGFAAGIDEFLAKPLVVPEAVARVHLALQHRRALDRMGREGPLRFGDLTVDAAGRVVAIAGCPVHLKTKEFELLVLLVRSPERVIVTRRILEEVWGDVSPLHGASLRVHVTALRNKLGSGPQRPRVTNVRGVGYCLTLGRDRSSPGGSLGA
jgi:two-component system KDP operon response regulator KdpE